MTENRRPRRHWFEFGGLVLLGVGLVILFNWAQGNLVQKPNFSGIAAYPPPTFAVFPPPSPEAINLLASPQPTATSVPLPIPPPGWPTELPWPPIMASQTAVPTISPLYFPTPAFLIDLAGARPSNLQSLWLAYYPKPDSEPRLWGFDIDDQFHHWGMYELPINLVIPKPQLGPDPGPVLRTLHLSPDKKWLVADFAYRGSQLVDLLSGEIVSLPEGVLRSYWRFFDWMPGEKIKLAVADQEFPSQGFWVVDPFSKKSEPVKLHNLSDEDATLRALSYSPDGARLGYATVFPARAGVRDTEVAEVRIVDNETQILAQIKGGVSFVEHSLKWSPDGDKLIWIVDGRDNEAGISQNQLWMAELPTGKSKMLGVLSESVQYTNPAVWSPDGATIAAIAIEQADKDREIINNICLINSETGLQRRLTHFSSSSISNLHWSSDGNWLAFTIGFGDYCEIWAVNITEEAYYPIAGPALCDAPFVWSQ